MYSRFDARVGEVYIHIPRHLCAPRKQGLIFVFIVFVVYMKVIYGYSRFLLCTLYSVMINLSIILQRFQQFKKNVVVPMLVSNVLNKTA